MPYLIPSLTNSPLTYILIQIPLKFKHIKQIAIGDANLAPPMAIKLVLHAQINWIQECIKSMNYCKGRVTKLLVDYFDDDFRRITHALEVLKHAERIMENTENCDFEVLVAAALLHDIGIKQSEEILGYNNGKTQEEYGPPIAEKLLESINFPSAKTRIVCEMIGNHHSRSRYDYVELKVLKEADRIVNKLEGN